MYLDHSQTTANGKTYRRVLLRLARRFSRSVAKWSRREASRSALGGSAAAPGYFGGAMGVRRSAGPT